MDCYRSLLLTAHAVLIMCAATVLRADSELDSLIDEAMAGNPRVAAAQQRVEQSLAKHRELLEFFDPTLYLAAGKAERARGVPGSSGYTSLIGNGHEVQGGVEVPLEPGAYLSAGAASRFLSEPGSYNHLYQNLLGLRLRIPLLRDRGFSQWDLSRSRALAEVNGAVSELLGVMQVLRHDVELAYISCYETLSAYQVAREATARFKALYDEAQELAGLKVVPEYQVHPAAMELELHRESELRALQAHEQSLLRLAGLLGTGRQVTMQSGPEILVQIAREVELPPDISVDEALGRNGAYLQLLTQLESLRAQLQRSRDDLRPDLSLNMGLTWQGEDRHNLVTSSSMTADEMLGGDVVLVWSRPLEYRGAHSRISHHRAHIAELKSRLDEVRIGIETDLSVATLSYRRSQERLGTLAKAIDASRETVSAEQERFRLGEGQSRNVLDAQKDLTGVLERQTQTAAELLRARSNFMYAAGYDLRP